MISSFVRAALATVAVVGVAACSGSGSGSPTATTVNAEEKEFSIALASTMVPAGNVTFNVKNAGTITHEFVVVSTDKPADQLPQASGEVDEDQLTAVDEVEDIEADATPTLSVDLAAGHYVVLCNIPGHYAAGMHADLTVE